MEPRGNMATRGDADLLRGVKEIARHLGRTVKQTEYWIRKGHVPTFKVGGAVCATRSAIAAHFNALAGYSGKFGDSRDYSEEA